MKRLVTFVAGASLALAVAAPALGHVTVQPDEATIGSFSRFVVRVPNERDNAGTIRVELRLPPLASVSFEPKDGWQREEETGEFDEPLEAFGEEVTEGVVSVTWSGGRVAPGEFTEFGFSTRTPDEETTLVFRAIQTYDSGEVVRWTGAPDSDTPAATLTTYDIGAGEDQGQLAVLAELADQVAAAEDGSTGDDAEEAPEGTAGEDDDDDDDDDSVGLVLGGVGAGLGALALIVALVALRRKP